MNKQLENYQHILCKEFPDFLIPYLELDIMQRLKGIGLFCGCDYTSLFHPKFFYSRYDHSVGVALIIYHFTQDKKQTIAGLLHDVSSPVFSHAIDFFNNDHIKQESTEDLNIEMIKNCKELIPLLENDGILLEEVLDYKDYPIADNPSPRLCADRLEYYFATAWLMLHTIDLKDIHSIYHKIKVMNNEEDLPELGFIDSDSAYHFLDLMHQCSLYYLSKEDKLALQLLADILKKMGQDRLMTTHDFYTMSEKEVIEKIKSSPYASIFNVFSNLKEVLYSPTKPVSKYNIKLEVKKRFVNPLLNGERLSNDKKANAIIREIKDYIDPYYTYIDLEDFRDDH